MPIRSDYECRMMDVRRQAGQHLESICKSGVDKKIFAEFLARELKAKSSKKEKDCETVIEYFSEIPKLYFTP